MKRSTSRIKNKNSNKIGSSIFWITLTLYAVGMFAIFSGTSPTSMRLFGSEYYFALRHTISVFIGITLMIVASKINFLFWKKFSKYFFIAVLIALVLVFIPGLGIKVLGASRWLNLGFTSIQPSEIAKLCLILYFSYLATKNTDIVSYLVLGGLVSGLILLEPDLGTSVTVAAISIVLMFITGADLKKMSLILIGVSLLSLVVVMSSSYRRDRLMTYLGNNENDSLGKSYHINQILYALGSGGIFGVGIGESRQKYLYLPETATDSIFPIFAEEFGFAGSVALIILMFSYIYKMVVISLSVDDKFASVFTAGVAAWICIQTVFNLGSMVALLPLTGIPLPFISYGGTAIIMLGLATGIAINIENYAKR